MSNIDLKKYIDKIPNFPKEGILFMDISPLLANAEAWAKTIDIISQEVKKMQPDILIGIESRGFILSAPIALKLNLGFAMIRKEGKLPGELISHNYDLEYGSGIIEIQKNLIKPGK